MSLGTFLGNSWTRVRGRVTRFFTYVGGAVTIYTGYQLYRMNVEESLMYPHAVLYVNLSRYAMSDGSAPSKWDLMQSLMQGRDLKHLQDVIDSLRTAKEDPRIHGLVANMSHLNMMSLAQAQELSEAIRDFSAQGQKFSIAYSDTFESQAAYYLATFCDKIYLQPGGNLGLVGLRVEHYFFRNLLDMVGIVPRLFTRHEYKTFAHGCMHEQSTPEQRENTQSILKSLNEQLVTDIARNRQLSKEILQTHIDEGPLTSEQACHYGLVDETLYHDQALVLAEKRVEEALKTTTHDALPSAVAKGRFLSLAKYHDIRLKPQPAFYFGEKSKVALIHCKGPIESSEMGQMPTLLKAFRQAIQDDRVRMIVFRINSPGGSPLASETLARQVEIAQMKGKKVIASFGNVAASGGYFIAAGCDRILANPGTITGSIGVLGGKAFINQKLWNKLGIRYEVFETAKNAGLFSPLSDFSKQQVKHVNAHLDRVYADFTKRVAVGRNLSLEELDEIARGRVFTGLEAKRVGLVDDLGGLATAKKLAAEWLNVAEADVIYQTFPKRRTLFQSLMEARLSRDEIDREDYRWDMTLSEDLLKPMMLHLWQQLKSSTVALVGSTAVQSHEEAMKADRIYDDIK